MEKAESCYPKYSDMPDIKEDGSENIRYDNPDFPLFCRRNFIPARQILVGMSVHWHSDIEFVYIMEIVRREAHRRWIVLEYQREK